VFDTNENNLMLDTPISTASHLVTEPCQLWNGFGYDFL
jgi:hypothetical protein